MPHPKDIQHAANLYDRRMQQKGLCSPVRRDGFIDGLVLGRKEAEGFLNALHKISQCSDMGSAESAIAYMKVLASDSINQYLNK